MDRARFNALKVNDFVEFLPQEWSHSDRYETELYILVELSDSSQEYAAVRDQFTITPKCIKRIQHPTSVLLYLINEEYRRAKGYDPHEVYKFLNLASGDVETYLKNNCDSRFLRLSEMPRSIPSPNAGTTTIMIKENASCGEDISRYPMYLIEF